MTERLHFHFSLSCTGEGNGNPLQYSCLENPRDGGAWWAAIYGVAQSRTRLKCLSSSSSSHSLKSTVWITTNCRKFFKRWEYQTTRPASWEICMQVKKQQIELDMEQQIVSKSGKECIKAVYCHPAYLIYMQSASCKMPGWNQYCREKYQ